MAIATAFKPEYIEQKELSHALLSACLSSALDDTGCSDKHMDLRAHRILATAVCGDYKIQCWWASEQEETISDCKPMRTVDKQHATLLGICAFPRSGKSGDAEAIARLNARIKAALEQQIRSRTDARPTGMP